MSDSAQDSERGEVAAAAESHRKETKESPKAETDRERWCRQAATPEESAGASLCRIREVAGAGWKLRQPPQSQDKEMSLGEGDTESILDQLRRQTEPNPEYEWMKAELAINVVVAMASTEVLQTWPVVHQIVIDNGCVWQKLESFGCKHYLQQDVVFLILMGQCIAP
eukprot:CAMPEP_0184325878 /NCGR_PEP_ID=MMETSP1049-20130417/142268_1 /TAXON_ID=77928 /ORGANISM="Proteomonas sulcata, Strain CCMP704" /LENGTH=166 /DNA_ID=CAMNT_0026648041 /DNA_START=263 /DNA_END=763 /DNA_ORIENTATION=+